jgi:hypothetical protein
MADQLVTPDELASYLQVPTLDTATAVLLIELATGKVQAAAGQLLVQGTATVTLDVDMCEDSQWLPLPQMPVRSVATVLIDGVTDTSWRLRRQQLWRMNGWNTNSSFPTQVTPTFTYGYAAGAQALQLARDMTFSLAGAGYGNPSAGVVSAEQLDDYRVEYADANARMVVTDFMRAQLRDFYGVSAYISSSQG